MPGKIPSRFPTPCPRQETQDLVFSNPWFDGALQHGRHEQNLRLLARQSTTVLSVRYHAVRLLSDASELMNETLWAMLTVFGLGIVYFLAAIPTGVALRLDPGVAALCAWAGYTAIAAAMLVIGTPARRWPESKFEFPLVQIPRSSSGASGPVGDCQVSPCLRQSPAVLTSRRSSLLRLEKSLGASCYGSPSA